MIAKQYSIALPADYDMQIIRDRVATKGSAMDDFLGLCFKAFLIRERGRFGAIGNEYAPFYVWSTNEGLWNFVAGAGFRGIVDSFGWQPIRSWVPIALAVRPGLRSLPVASASRRHDEIAVGADLAALRLQQHELSAASLNDDARIAARVVAVDIERWTMLSFTLWTCALEALLAEPATDRFEVLHLSAPLAAADALEDGPGRRQPPPPTPDQRDRHPLQAGVQLRERAAGPPRRSTPTPRG